MILTVFIMSSNFADSVPLALTSWFTIWVTFVKPTLDCRLKWIIFSFACLPACVWYNKNESLRTKCQRTLTVPNPLVKGIDRGGRRAKEKIFTHSQWWFVAYWTETDSAVVFIFFSQFLLNLASRPYMDMGRFQFFIVPPLLCMVNAFSPKKTKWNVRFRPKHKFYYSVSLCEPCCCCCCIQLAMMTIAILPSK